MQFGKPGYDEIILDDSEVPSSKLKTVLPLAILGVVSVSAAIVGLVNSGLFRAAEEANLENGMSADVSAHSAVDLLASMLDNAEGELQADDELCNTVLNESGEEETVCKKKEEDSKEEKQDEEEAEDDKGEETVKKARFNSKAAEDDIDGSLEDETELIPVTGISLNRKAVALKMGETTTLGGSILPKNATNTSVVWRSTNPAVATVTQNGRVTAVGEGAAEIIVMTADGGFEDTCLIAVAASSSSTKASEQTENNNTTPVSPSYSELAVSARLERRELANGIYKVALVLDISGGNGTYRTSSNLKRGTESFGLIQSASDATLQFYNTNQTGTFSATYTVQDTAGHVSTGTVTAAL